MAGYTPLFASLTTGTLCGKWPDIGLWPIVLSLADRYGIVDVTPDYLCRVTGLQCEAVTACMQRFCEPDPYSRSQEAAGARLKLLDPARSWGWQVINHRAYREKARKETFDAARVADGRNAQRLKTRADPRSSAQTRADPPSDSDSNTDSNKKKKPDRRTARAVDEPEGFAEVRQNYPKRAGGQRWGDALKFFQRRISEGASVEVILTGVRRYAEFARATGIERTDKVQQAATFLGDNRGYLELWQPPPPPLSAVERVKAKLSGNGNERVVSEQFGTESQPGLGTVSRVLRRIPDS